MTMRTTVMCLALAGLGLAATGCAKQNPKMMVTELEQKLQDKEEKIGELQSTLKQTESDLTRTQSDARAKAEEAAAMKAKAETASMDAKRALETCEADQKSGTMTASAGSGFGGTDMLPPKAVPGECYARVFVPPTYKTDTERMLAREATEKLEIIPAKFEWAEERVLVKEASTRLEVVPAEYRWTDEKVMVKPASSTIVEVPAKYEWTEEKVLVKPAHTVWKKGRGPVEKVDNATGEIMCLVEVPASYESVKKKIQLAPPTTQKVEVPAEYKTVKTKVLAKPATTRTVEIPAEYKTIKVQKIVEPARERRVAVPAEYQTVSRTAQVTEGSMAWREVMCETNLTPDMIRSLQRAVQSAGFNPGPIDGVYGAQTSNAVRAYQRANGLATGGLTMKTVEKLNVKL